MNILETIIERKKAEVVENKKAVSVKTLESSPFFSRVPLPLTGFLLDAGKTGIIAEFKRRSPSKGVINADADVAAITSAYVHHGASGLSVLTDQDFFGGSNADLIAARSNRAPILRNSSARPS